MRRGGVKAFLIQIRPAEQRVVGFHPDNISPNVLQRLLKTRLVANRELCALEGIGVVRYARAYRHPMEWDDEPRWQLGPTEPVAGFSILFGMNAKGKAANCPVDLDFVKRNITWLPSAAAARANLAEAQAALDRLAGRDDKPS